MDADFSGNWDAESAEHDESTAKSRHGYIETLNNVPLFWASKLQAYATLSSTESEYVGLSEASRVMLPMIRLLQELNGKGFDTGTTTPTVQCTLFEDNSGDIELATVPKMQPRTKHLNVRYHHFCDSVKKGIVKIIKISTEEQPVEILTKSMPV